MSAFSNKLSWTEVIESEILDEEIKYNLRSEWQEEPATQKSEKAFQEERAASAKALGWI